MSFAISSIAHSELLTILVGAAQLKVGRCLKGDRIVEDHFRIGARPCIGQSKVKGDADNANSVTQFANANPRAVGALALWMRNFPLSVAR